MDIQKQFIQHRHNGADSVRIQLSDAEGTLADINGTLSDIVTPSATITDPGGGITQDLQARDAIDAILDLLQEQGLME